MAKKTTEKDVLIVRDEKTGEISVVAGLDAPTATRALPPQRRRTRRVSCNSTGTETCWTTSSRTSSGSARNPAASVSTVSRRSQSRQAAGSYQGLAERPRGQQGDACAPQGGHLRLRGRKYRRSSPPKSRNNRNRNKMTNLKNRKKWNRKTNRIRKARSRRRATGATNPSTRARSTGRSWRRNGA